MENLAEGPNSIPALADRSLRTPSRLFLAGMICALLTQVLGSRFAASSLAVLLRDLGFAVMVGVTPSISLFLTLVLRQQHLPAFVTSRWLACAGWIAVFLGAILFVVALLPYPGTRITIIRHVLDMPAPPN